MDESSQMALVRALLAAFAARDLDGLAALLADDVDWQAPGGLPFGGHLFGRDAVRGYLTDLWGFFEDVDLGQPQLFGSGPTIMATGVQTVRTSSGAEHRLEFSQLFTVQDGLVVRYRERNDAGEMVRVVLGEIQRVPDRP